MPLRCILFLANSAVKHDGRGAFCSKTLQEKDYRNFNFDTSVRIPFAPPFRNKTGHAQGFRFYARARYGDQVSEQTALGPRDADFLVCNLDPLRQEPKVVAAVPHANRLHAERRLQVDEGFLWA
jgi:hypothetical protein